MSLVGERFSCEKLKSGKACMTRDEIRVEIIRVFNELFEIENPGDDDDLREVYEFDSIDAIELLREIEIMLGSPLTRPEKKKAMEIRTINHIIDYVESLSLTRSNASSNPDNISS